MAGGDVKILIPTPLRQYAGKKSSVEVTAGTVGEALQLLATENPELRKHLYADDGALQAYINVYLNDDDIRYLEGKENAPVKVGDVISIVPSIAGGHDC
jgi:adenylyltransferase/sulfurtransferase